jgi:hypothetical protein
MMKKQYLTDLIGNHYVDSILVVQLLSDNHTPPHTLFKT